MTAQITDTFIFKDEAFSLTGYTDDIPFFPEHYNISTMSASSACWRGFVRTFCIHDNALSIKALRVNDADIAEKPYLPEINGVKPKLNKGEIVFFNKSYEDLFMTIDFTGSILIGKDFIRDLYVHMGFHPAWKYETVYELTFEKGNLENLIDLSDKMEEIRNKWEEIKNAKDKPIEHVDIAQWIKEAFNQKYKRR